MRNVLSFCLAVAALATTHPSPAVEISIDGRASLDAAAALPFPVGGRSLDGHVLSANRRYLTRDGQPWFPVMGEFHYSRYPAAEWEPELLKMKAGGVAVVATYLFWLHHEETEGQFNWSGQRDVRRFIELCHRHGLLVWIRIGPWCHGETRNGGLPDWLVKSGVPLRQNDERYLAYVKRYFGQIAQQVKGQFWQDGGPIIGVQIENEYHPPRQGIEHMRTLRQLAMESGIVAPYCSATGWDNAAVPKTDFLPVFGGYTEQFWSGSLEPLPPNQNFFFTTIRAEDNVMGDLTPKNPEYATRFDAFPYLTAELGGGMSIAYHRRPIMYPEDSTASALVKLGAGANLLGFYMYHGGTNPDGLTSLQETQSVWNGYNDMEAKSYDFQAPLGEFGQVNETYRTLRTLALFLDDFGSVVAPMPAYFPALMPKNRDDRVTPRVVARTDGRQGFIFINNYERNYPLGDKPDFQVSLQLADGKVTVPRTPITVPNGAYPIWPVNLDLGIARLRYATAQPIAHLAAENTWVFFAWPGLAAQFAIETPKGVTVDAVHGHVTTLEGITYVDQLPTDGSVAIRISDERGARQNIVLLSREAALGLARVKLGGRDTLLTSPATVVVNGNQLQLSSRDAASLHVGVFPSIRSITGNFRSAGTSGVFQTFTSSTSFPTSGASVDVQPLRQADVVPPVRLSAPPRAVAMEPEEKDFDRAAEWLIKVDPTLGDPAQRNFLQVRYEGDVARVYAGGRFDNDNFYKGTPWELALWRYSAADLKEGIHLKILPLRRDAPFFLEESAHPNFGPESQLARLKNVSVAREYRVDGVIQP